MDCAIVALFIATYSPTLLPINKNEYNVGQGMADWGEG